MDRRYWADIHQESRGWQRIGRHQRRGTLFFICSMVNGGSKVYITDLREHTSESNQLVALGLEELDNVRNDLVGGGLDGLVVQRLLGGENDISR